MAAQSVNIIYRTGEHGGKFRTAYNITLFNKTATIQGVSGTVTPQCWRELAAYFILNGITHYEYARVKNGNCYTVRRPVRGF